MSSLTTHGVNINVKVSYHTVSNFEGRPGYVFIYHIVISNNNSFPIQLKSRKWIIFDSEGTTRFVEGEGVVGLQPIIQPDQSFEYSSFCNLNTQLGSMSGFYFLENLDDKSSFEVTIPVFELATPGIMNWISITFLKFYKTFKLSTSLKAHPAFPRPNVIKLTNWNQ